ncbi:xanthine dehydrogenase small subunit [Candidatus Pelagibacter sp.]|nr:xanthine dehydrogenase small subunit [Candidatus Pelagibacter sp.]
MISSSVKFLLNDKLIVIKNPDPNQTLLNYIRTELKKTGTKEGCSEGGCGACTIVLGELVDNKIEYKAINSCISFVPSLNGKQLIIVEDLVSQNGKLHPVQDAMVKFHGSQCGFCTPGFVMSLFSMFKNNKKLSNELITDSISGNLCRCTGYRPIIDAAKSLNKINKNDQFSKNKNKVIQQLKKIKPKNVYIKKNDKIYFSPKKIKDLKGIIKKHSKFSFLAGGTDLSLKVTKERKEIPFIIDLKEINELDFVKVSKNYLEVGSATPLIKFEKEIKKYYPDFYSVLKRYGSVQIRNVGTIGGNIATASPIGDSLPILLSLNAEVLIESFNKRKVLPLNNFFLDYRKTKLKNNEFIYSIKIPLFKKNIFKAFKISKRFDDDISSVCGSFNFEINNNKIKEVFIAYGGMAAVPKRAKACEKILKNKPLTINTFDQAKKYLEKDLSPIGDMRASKEYRLEIAKNLLMKCFVEINSNKLSRVN